MEEGSVGVGDIGSESEGEFRGAASRMIIYKRGSDMSRVHVRASRRQTSARTFCPVRRRRATIH